MPKVKICGLSRPQDIAAVNAAGADYGGFVFFEKSKRNISFAQAEALLALLSPKIQSVAVCVSPDLALVGRIREMGFDIIQIHGAVPEGIENMLAAKKDGTAHGDGGLALWRAVNIGGVMELETSIGGDTIAEGYVVDGANYGGGKTFGWEDDANFDRSVVETLHKKLNKKTFVLAGGLNVENVRKGIEIFRPDVVDVSSGVETDGGKNPELIHRFICEVRSNSYN